MSDSRIAATAALAGAIIGGSFTLAGQYLLVSSAEEQENQRLVLDAAREHYVADTNRILGTNRLRGRALSSFADYVSYHQKVWAAAESGEISDEFRDSLESQFPLLAPGYLSVLDE